MDVNNYFKIGAKLKYESFVAMATQSVIPQNCCYTISVTLYYGYVILLRDVSRLFANHLGQDLDNFNRCHRNKIIHTDLFIYSVGEDSQQAYFFELASSLFKFAQIIYYWKVQVL